MVNLHPDGRAECVRGDRRDTERVQRRANLLSGSGAGDDAGPVTHIPRSGMRRSRRLGSIYVPVPPRGGLPKYEPITQPPGLLRRPVRRPRKGVRRVSGHQPGSGWNQAIRGEPPQGDQQFAGDSHDGPLADATIVGCTIGMEPLGDRAVGLKPDPAPRHLDQMLADQRVARLADPLVMGNGAAGSGNPGRRPRPRAAWHRCSRCPRAARGWPPWTASHRDGSTGPPVRPWRPRWRPVV